MELFTSVIFRMLLREGTVLLLLSVLSHWQADKPKFKKSKVGRKSLCSVHPGVFTLYKGQLVTE